MKRDEEEEERRSDQEQSFSMYGFDLIVCVLTTESLLEVNGLTDFQGLDYREFYVYKTSRHPMLKL
jgi:hypothetical protein